MLKWIETTGRSEEDAISAALFQLGGRCVVGDHKHRFKLNGDIAVLHLAANVLVVEHAVVAGVVVNRRERGETPLDLFLSLAVLGCQLGEHSLVGRIILTGSRLFHACLRQFHRAVIVALGRGRLATVATLDVVTQKIGCGKVGECLDNLV